MEFILTHVEWGGGARGQEPKKIGEGGGGAGGTRECNWTGFPGPVMGTEKICKNFLAMLSKHFAVEIGQRGRGKGNEPRVQVTESASVRPPSPHTPVTHVT